MYETTIRWRTEEATDSVVVFGASRDALTRRVTILGKRLRHEVRLLGLLPDTRYFYGYGNSDSRLHGKTSEHYFKTFPVTGIASPTRVWIIGDSGHDGIEQSNVFEQYRSYSDKRVTDLWLILGDNAYGSGRDSEYQRALFDPYSDMLRNTVLFPTFGNHDDCLNRIDESECNDMASSLTGVTPYYEIFTLPDGGECGGVPSLAEAYYSFDYGNIHFVSLNSQTHSSNATMKQWLLQDLKATSADWIIAFWHHPPYTNESHNSDSEGPLVEMRENFGPILETYGVDLVFSGHSHGYERSALLHGYYDNSSSFNPERHVVMRNSDGTLADGDPTGDGTYIKTGNEGTVYSVVGSSSHTDASKYSTEYWSCPDGFLLNCENGPLLPGMFIHTEDLGSVVVDINESSGIADVVFLDTTTDEIGDHFQIAKL